MSFFRRNVGRAGEAAAEKFLRGLGYRVLQRNYDSGIGEIDLICRDGETLVFVEVKALSDDVAGDPEEHVNSAKQRQIEKVARRWLQSRGEPEGSCRFDVVSVIMQASGPPKVRHIIEAFAPTRWCR